MNDIELRIKQLEDEIATLPVGGVTTKKINGNRYKYHRVYVNGKRKEFYVPANKVDGLVRGINRRKECELEIKELKSRLPKPEKKSKTKKPKNLTFNSNVIIGNSLSKFSSSVSSYKKRFCFGQLKDYVYGDSEKVFILYGLRRTGKTTMIRQIINEMPSDDLGKTAFIQVTSRDSMASINQDMKLLEENDFKFVFIDEVTMLDDFVEGAALFSDVFASCGMKIVLSGTDSLGFMLSADEQLYDRCKMIHTTFISYKEFKYVLGIDDIDEYIRYGGTMSISGVDYNESTFANEKTAHEYVDTAIARNIQHSLKCYQEGTHFRHLQDLYDNNELTSAINRVVEDINHRFTKEILTKPFLSNDLSISARNLRKDNDILDNIDRESVVDRLKKLFEIIDKENQNIEIKDIHAKEIKEYFDILDLTCDIDVVSIPNVNDIQHQTVITQPGMRYCQVNALIDSLLKDETFSDLSLVERNAVLERIRNEVKGRMLEDIVLLETKFNNPDKEVFKLKFAIGEFDMVIYDPQTSSCELFEIKHSKEQVDEQFKHLNDAEKLKQTEHYYGKIASRTVLYRGENKSIDGINYQNIEEFLSR